MFWRTVCIGCGPTFGGRQRRSEPEASPEANGQGHSGCAASTAALAGKTAVAVATRTAKAALPLGRAKPKTPAVGIGVTRPRQDTVPFVSCPEEQKLRFQGADHFAALRGR